MLVTVPTDSGIANLRWPPLSPLGAPGHGRHDRSTASSTMTSSTTDSVEHAAQHEIDIHTTAGKLVDLRKRRSWPSRRGAR